jgi:hypothetical protein
MYTASDQSTGGDKGVCVEGLRNGCKVEKGVWVQEVGLRAWQEGGSAIVRRKSRQAKALFRLHFCPIEEVAFARPYQHSFFDNFTKHCTSWVYTVGTGLGRRETEYFGTITSYIDDAREFD